jgi:hypothetical protein
MSAVVVPLPAWTDIPMTARRARTHLAQWRCRVLASYDLTRGELSLSVVRVRERWLVRAKPATALRLVRAFGVPLHIR